MLKKTSILTISVLCLLSSFYLSGCGGHLAKNNETIRGKGIMSAKDKIMATNSFGTLTITAGKDNLRYLTLSGEGTKRYSTFSGEGRYDEWIGDTSRVKLTEGAIEYYYPQRGLRCDSGIKKLRHKKDKDFEGPAQVKMEESQLHFETFKEAEEWINSPPFSEDYNPRVFSSDGLYVRWKHVFPEYWIIPKESYLHIQLFQVYVNGQKPSNLSGARDDKIKVEHLTEEQLKDCEKSATRWR